MVAIAVVNEYTLRIETTMIDDMNSLAEFLKTNDRITDVYDVGEWISPELLSKVQPGLVDLKQ